MFKRTLTRALFPLVLGQFDNETDVITITLKGIFNLN